MTSDHEFRLPGVGKALNEALQSWSQYLEAERRLSPRTAEAYRRDIRQFFEFLQAHAPERRLTPRPPPRKPVRLPASLGCAAAHHGIRIGVEPGTQA